MRKTPLIILVAFSLLIIGVVAVGIVKMRIPGSGTVKTINVAAFWDESCTDPVSAVNWGSMFPGESTTILIYLKNTGSVPMILTLTTENWIPAVAESHLQVVWDQENTILQPGQVQAASFTLSVSSGAVGFTDFSFDVVITGAEQ